jgi:hypothetical protein
VLVALVTASLVPAEAHAAKCSDYPNQAAAQRAADTRDADGDGVYCESLPCPCASASGGGGGGGGGGTSSPKPKSTPKPKPKPKPKSDPVLAKVGAARSLGRRTKGSHCHVRGPLPDPRCTPGSVFGRSVPKLFCVSGYTKHVRHVTEGMKDRVYAEYGVTSHRRGQYEVDHLVPLELGGSNTIANLFPELATPRPGFHDKDELENRAHARACAGQGDWRAMQRRIAKDWTKLYVRLIGELPG